MQQIVIVSFGVLLMIGCSIDDNNYNTSDIDPLDNQDPDPVVEAKSVRLPVDATSGNLMTDSEGFNLYFFAKDNYG